MDVQACLAENIGKGDRCAILGVGSQLRADDGAGMYFIELLNDRLKRDDILLIAGSTAPENFTGVIKKYAPDKLIIVDAAHMGLEPGMVDVLPANAIGGVSFSTHMLPLSVMLDYLEFESKCDVIFIGIQPKSTEQAIEMCQEVRKGTEALAEIFCKAFSQVPDGK